jgi:hypothetical protein
MAEPEPGIERKPTDNDIRIFLALYAAERLDSAYLMQAGRAILGTLLVYAGGAAAITGKLQDAPLLTLILPIPAIGLLIVFGVNGFNLSLRDVSGRTLETLLHRATSEYLPNWTVDSIPEISPDDGMVLHRKHFREPSPLREVAIGLSATDHFYNRRRANKHQLWFLRIYTALTAFLVLTGMVLLLCYGLYQVFGQHQGAKWNNLEWTVMWLEVAVFIALVVIYVWTLVSGAKHRKRAETAASILRRALPAGPSSGR